MLIGAAGCPAQPQSPQIWTECVQIRCLRNPHSIYLRRLIEGPNRLLSSGFSIMFAKVALKDVLLGACLAMSLTRNSGCLLWGLGSATCTISTPDDSSISR